MRRGVTAACVLGVPIAALLDGAGFRPSWAPPSIGWLDLAAGLALAWAAMQPGALRSRENWETPFNGLLLALLALAAVATVGEHGAGAATPVLRQVLACAAAFVALTSISRRDRDASEIAWRAMGLVTVVLGLHAMWAATTGLATVQADATAVDLRWAGTQGLGRLLGFVTLACAGRASEPGAPSAWRLVVLLGVAGLGIHVAAGSLVLARVSLARLSAPLDFSSACVTWLLAMALARGAWERHRERRSESRRWRLLAIATAVLGLVGVLGDGSGGEGVRAMAVLAGICVLAPPAAAETDSAFEEAGEADLARAA